MPGSVTYLEISYFRAEINVVFKAYCRTALGRAFLATFLAAFLARLPTTLLTTRVASRGLRWPHSVSSSVTYLEISMRCRREVSAALGRAFLAPFLATVLASFSAV